MYLPAKSTATARTMAKAPISTDCLSDTEIHVLATSHTICNIAYIKYFREYVSLGYW